MEQAYIVIFESKLKAVAIRNYLRTYNGWAKITDNAFAILSSKSATAIRDELLQIKDPSDRIMVIKSGVVAAWSNAAASNEWLKKNL